MFVRAQRSGKRTYLLVVENEWASSRERVGSGKGQAKGTASLRSAGYPAKDGQT